jgi:glutamate racemase
VSGGGRLRVGVFDSGFGGLTVLRALLEQTPEADYVYLGDSARLPYGSKSARTVAHYATSSARFLYEQGIDMLIIACNTASAMALDEIKHAVPVPVIGVIEPGALLAKHATRSGQVCVIGTQATISSHAYEKALAALGVAAQEKACPLFVPLVEEGWTDHPVTVQVASIYFDELFADCAMSMGASANPDTLVLGCTHYPLLKPLLNRVLRRPMEMIDSADAIAQQVQAALANGCGQGTGSVRFFATDSLEKFKVLGARFLGRTIASVQLVELPE